MARYYFDTFDGKTDIRDADGLELPDVDAARQEVLKALPEIARDTVPGGGDRRDWTVDARDHSGRVVYTATLSLVARRID